MKQKAIITLTILIATGSIVASLFGLLDTEGVGAEDFLSVHDQLVVLYGKGLYFRDSVSVASQGIASDFITLMIAVPTLLLSLVFFLQKRFFGQVMLTGIVGYFLYTYMSYTFLWNYNELFLLYVFLMGASLYLFVFMISTYKLDSISDRFEETLPTTFLGGYQIVIGVVIGLMWLGIIFQGLRTGTTPEIVEHYTTLVIQAMDLGIVVPTAIFSGILLIQKQPLGYLLSSIVIVKGTMMLIAILAMIANQAIEGVTIDPVQTIIFTLFTLLSVYCFYLLLKHCKKELPSI